MPLLRSLAENATLVDVRGIYGELPDRPSPFTQQLMRGPLPLKPSEREPIGAYVSGVSSCHNCDGSRSLVARGCSIHEFAFKSLVDGVEFAPIDGRHKPVLRDVCKLTETPSRITQADADAVYQVGWSDDALVPTFAVWAYFDNMDRPYEDTSMLRAT